MRINLIQAIKLTAGDYLNTDLRGGVELPPRHRDRQGWQKLSSTEFDPQTQSVAVWFEGNEGQFDRIFLADELVDMWHPGMQSEVMEELARL